MTFLSDSMDSVTLPCPGRHPSLRVVTLVGKSDLNNNLVLVNDYVPRRDCSAAVSGKIFHVTSLIDRRTTVIISTSPEVIDASVRIDTRDIHIFPNGYPVYCATCDPADAERVTRAFFAEKCPLPLFAMLNNWGDGSHGKNINEDFYLREIEAAHDIGLDVVQIDDGWQVGSSADARIFLPDGTYTGYRNFSESFWEVDTAKFPHGLAPLVKMAAEYGIKMGLWFAPDSRDHFAARERDAAILHRAYDAGFRYFKLDLLRVRDRKDREAFLSFLRAVHAFGPDISLQLDVTGQFDRMGLTDACEFGKMFVENRYAYYADDYAPSQTLRNLWELSRYLPAQFFQFEFPNVRRFADIYDATDPISPVSYLADWRLASVMASCPLFWMEAQYLDAAERDAIRPVLTAWRENRDLLAACDIAPVGHAPDGCSVTGFLALSGSTGFLIALREASPDDTLSVSLPSAPLSRTLLASSRCVTTSAAENTLTVRFTDKMQYAFCRFTL